RIADDYELSQRGHAERSRQPHITDAGHGVGRHFESYFKLVDSWPFLTGFERGRRIYFGNDLVAADEDFVSPMQAITGLDFALRSRADLHRHGRNAHQHWIGLLTIESRA